MASNEKLLQRRSQMLQLTVIGFTLWQGALLLADLVTVSGLAARALNVTQAIGMIIFGLSMLRLAQLMHSARKQEVAELLGDELAKLQQYKAFFLAYFAVAGLAAFFLGIVGYVDIEAQVLTRILVMVAVVTPLLSFLWLDHKAGLEDAH